MRHQSRTASAADRIRALADRQHGVVARRQLLAAGVSRGELRAWLARGVLIPRHRGVYRVGHRAPSALAAYMAAVLACGDGARLRGLAAAHLHRLTTSPARPEVETATERRIAGVRTVRGRRLDRGETVLVRRIPVTSLPRTLIDLAGALPTDELARAVHQAAVLHRVGAEAVESTLRRRPNAPGAASLRAVLRGDVRVSLSRLEAVFCERLARAGLPPPETNVSATGRRVDCRWPDHRLTVELDGYRYHHTRHAWELDRRREREARARGDDFRRFTYDDVFVRPQQLVAELRGALRGSG